MLFPIIKVKSKCFKEAEIVGTNSHHKLYVDKQTGGLHFLNMQCMAGTKRYGSKDADYSFCGNEPNEYEENITVEFVTIEELIRIAIDNMKEQTEAKLKMDEMFNEYIEEQKRCKEKLKDAIPDTSGILPF
jgi:hypothetical protein|uniref:Uncharacterized protein n=1 Tax=Caudovirales sp. ctCiv1 TaxID=2826769 RepID=A0A8S5M871_9CAUD|nr:hypothetical protein [uncultured Lachnoclostridium sp.]DAD78545.1 MAG TPA: hypothetical protein [Caudovirales sp. ctCiv1]